MNFNPDQFDGECPYATPDPEKEYIIVINDVHPKGCKTVCTVKGVTLLMKWIILAEKHPDLIERIEKKVKKNKAIVNQVTTDYAYSPLMLASCLNTEVGETIMKILIDAGCDIDLMDCTRSSAILFSSASTLTITKSMQILIEAGCEMPIGFMKVDGEPVQIWLTMAMSRYNNQYEKKDGDKNPFVELNIVGTLLDRNYKFTEEYIKIMLKLNMEDEIKKIYNTDTTQFEQCLKCVAQYGTKELFNHMMGRVIGNFIFLEKKIKFHTIIKCAITPNYREEIVESLVKYRKSFE